MNRYPKYKGDSITRKWVSIWIKILIEAIPLKPFKEGYFNSESAWYTGTYGVIYFYSFGQQHFRTLFYWYFFT